MTVDAAHAWGFGFNPRTRVGCDLGHLPDLHEGEGFNPRTRVGCDTASMSVLSTVRLFQSTHPRGVRL